MIELIESVLKNQSTVDVWKNDFKSKEYEQAGELNKLLFGIPLNRTVGCQCVNDLYIYLNNKHKKQYLMNLENRQFLIKQNKLIQLHGLGKVLSSHSSEEDCIKLLKDNPSQIAHFERYPANWKEIVNGETEEAEEVEEVEETDEVENVETEKTQEEEEPNNNRKEELEAMTTKALKSLIIEKELEIPKGNKGVLVQFILDAEA